MMKLKMAIYIVILGIGPMLLGDMPKKGLEAWWKLNGNAIDSIGSYNGTLQEVTFAEKGKASYAIFDGKKSCIKIKTADEQFVKNKQITVSAWIKPNDEWADKNGCIVNLGGFYGGWRVFLSQAANVKDNTSPTMLTFVMGAETINKGRVNLNVHDEVIRGDKWYHIVCTWDGIVMRAYVDGKLARSIKRKQAYVSKKKYWLGIGFNGQGVGHFKGFIKDVCIWGRSLSKHEVKSLFKFQKNGNSGLIKKKKSDKK